MRFLATNLPGAAVIELEKHEDQRGFFARSFCEGEFSAHGLESKFVQCNISYNRLAGTLRGMHYQASPNAEAKLVRCTTGAIYDVIVDLRADSETRGQWFGVELSQANRRMLYVPKGFAHGFQTLKHEAEVFYQMSDEFVPEASRGFRFDDPEIGIAWPLKVSAISDRDRQLPLWQECEA